MSKHPTVVTWNDLLAAIADIAKEHMPEFSLAPPDERTYQINGESVNEDAFSAKLQRVLNPED